MTDSRKDFTWALDRLKVGHKVRRQSWGASAYVYVNPHQILVRAMDPTALRPNRDSYWQSEWQDFTANDWELKKET